MKLNSLKSFVAALFMTVATTTSAATISVAASGATSLDPNDAELSGGSVKEVDGMNTFDSMRNGNTATFTLNLASASKYTIKFVAATKNNDVSMKFSFMSGETEEYSKTVAITNNGTWGSAQSDFVSYEFTTDQLSAGEKTLVITFVGPKYTCNAGNMTITPFDASANVYSLTTALNPEGAGTISVSPSKDNFNPNEEVTVSATANVGYEFKNWTDASGNVVSSDATYTFAITANTVLTANFDVADLTITVPTTEANPFKMENVKIDNQGDSRAKWDGDHIDYMFHGFTATYSINNTQATAYDIAFQAVTQNDNISVRFDIMSEDRTQTVATSTVQVPNSGGWSDWSDLTASIPELPVGKYSLVITFLNADAESDTEGGSYTTCNLKGISFNAKSSTGINTLKAAENNNDQIFDLNGRRLWQVPTKGAYIRNGKKIVVK